MQHTANQLMHEIASEVWRTAGGDKDEAQGRLLEALSRDQAIRSLIAHTDERFQTLAVRTARLEDTLNMIAEGMRTAREQLTRGVDALEDAQSAPAARGVADIQQRLDEVTRQIALAFETLAERDRAITQSVQQRVQEHGELVATETARITRAMEAYVQQGVQAMGQLAGSVESQISAIASRDDEVGARISQAAESQLQILDAKLHAITEQIAVDATTVNEAITYMLDTTDERNRSLGEFLELMNDRVGMETRDVLMAIEGMDDRAAERVRSTLDERLTKVEITAHDAAVRSAREVTHATEPVSWAWPSSCARTPMALRNELVGTVAAQDGRSPTRSTSVFGRVNDTLSRRRTGWSRRCRGGSARTSVQAIRMRLDEAIVTIEQHGEETARILNGRLDDAVVSIDRNMVRMADTLEGQLERLARTVGDRLDADAARRTAHSFAPRRSSARRSMHGLPRSRRWSGRTTSRSLGRSSPTRRPRSRRCAR